MNDRTALNRVPHIILLYWVIKIASTTLGETGADMVSMTFDLGYGTTIAIFLGLFAVLLGVKLALRGYHPTAYRATFTASAVAGTAISDAPKEACYWIAFLPANTLGTAGGFAAD